MAIEIPATRLPSVLCAARPMTTDTTPAPVNKAVPIDRNIGIKCAYKISKITHTNTEPNCCRKLMVVRSKCPLRVIEACTLARNIRDRSNASRTKKAK